MNARFEWRAGMREVSGFGGQYERCCRAVIRAGVEWLEAHPRSEPSFRGYRQVFGLVVPKDQAARELADAMDEAGREHGGMTSAMLQCCLSHVFFIERQGWDAYVLELSKSLAVRA